VGQALAVNLVCACACWDTLIFWGDRLSKDAVAGCTDAEAEALLDALAQVERPLDTLVSTDLLFSIDAAPAPMA
jgi:hypothetical protein